MTSQSSASPIPALVESSIKMKFGHERTSLIDIDS